MIKPVMLDATPLGKLAQRAPPAEIRDWYRALLSAGVQIIVPAVADFEVRRELLRAGLRSSVAALDDLKVVLTYAPITTAIMLTAAELWASARRHGRPTADPKELDCDVIIAAQAMDAGAVVATENVGHLARYVTALHWRAITPPPP